MCRVAQGTDTCSVAISLPGSTDEVFLGTPHAYGDTLYTGESERWQFARKHVYIGEAEYRREFRLPAKLRGKRVLLTLERCLWTSRIVVNGVEVGTRHSLSTSHDYDVTDYVKPGMNSLSVYIDNRPYVNLGTWSHAYSQGMQSIWNGIIGTLELTVHDALHIDEVQVWGDVERHEVRVRSRLHNTLNQRLRRGELRYTVCEKGTGRCVYEDVRPFSTEAVADTMIEHLCHLPDGTKAWDEFTPHLYEVTVELSCRGCRDRQTVVTGFRSITTEGYALKINGRKTFLRGEHDGGFFPVTGYPSMDTESWVQIFTTGKLYGMNHWRFHSWCPPEAAFRAADSLGLYLQVELPLFPQPWENTLLGTDDRRDAFLFEELQLILEQYGNHPSFVLMPMGNEMKGDPALLERWVAYAREHDDRHLYTNNSNPEAMGLYAPMAVDQYQVAHAARVGGARHERRLFTSVNYEYPNTSANYSHTFPQEGHRVPVISHEIGQWCVYPDFRQIGKFGDSCVWAPNSLLQFREELERKGMVHQAHDFMMASGKLAAAIYKEDMERCLRTPELTGFQLLDLRDYHCQGSALVGLLDAFWDNKGIITPEEFRSSCDEVTVLLEMDRRTWLNSAPFEARVVIPNYSASPLPPTTLSWQALDASGSVRFEGTLPVDAVAQGEVARVATITFPLASITEAAMLTLRLQLTGSEVTNEYKLWVYPTDCEVPEPRDIIVCRELSPRIREALASGAKVLLIPAAMPRLEPITFATPRWSTLMFTDQVKTMGLLCDPSHPLYRHFPTEPWSDWQWWELTRDARAVRLNGTDSSYLPILQVIDDYNRNDKLGAIMETRYGKGSLLVCTLDILTDLSSRPAAKQLRHSILRYMDSPAFAPAECEALVRMLSCD